jgi:hypothetical protein
VPQSPAQSITTINIPTAGRKPQEVNYAHGLCHRPLVEIDRVVTERRAPVETTSSHRKAGTPDNGARPARAQSRTTPALLF